MEDLKICKKCLLEFPIGMFSKNKHMRDGYSYYCKKCMKKYVANWYSRNTTKAREMNKKWRTKNRDKWNELSRKWRENNPEKEKIKCKKYRLKNKEKISQMNKTWRGNNPEKEKAKSTIRDLVQNGKIQKSGICTFCGSDKNIRGHHFDYDKPGEVIWVCQKCHSKIHKLKEEVA